MKAASEPYRHVLLVSDSHRSQDHANCQLPIVAYVANPWQSPVHPWYKPLHTQLTLTRTTLSPPVRTFSGITLHRFERTTAKCAKCEHKVPSARATPVEHANASGAVTPRCGRELRTHARLVQTPKGNQLVQRPSLKLTMCSSKGQG